LIRTGSIRTGSIGTGPIRTRALTRAMRTRPPGPIRRSGSTEMAKQWPQP
jgi:hypothetical protein